MEKQESQKNADTLLRSPNPDATHADEFKTTNEDTVYPEQIREAQGDIADRANIEIDQELQENIMRARESSDPSRQHYKESE
jgi:hypothetical protein